MQKMKITYSAYKYAPESAQATINGIKLDLTVSNAGLAICTRSNAEAEAELKKVYRKTIAKDSRFIYVFFAENSKQFYYVACLNFSGKADLAERLRNYKELKHHLQAHPIEIITESGTITPTGASKPEVKKEVVKIDFSRCRKLKIAV